MPNELISFVSIINKIVLIGKVYKDTVRKTKYEKKFKRK